MSTQLPPSPNLGFYRKLAKDLRKAHADGDATVAARIRAHHPEHSERADEAVLAAPFALADAQLVVARENGFTSWSRFRAAVLAAAEDPSLTAAERLAAAVRAGDVDGVRALLADTPDADRQPALLEACERGRVDVSRALLEAGADPVRGDEHWTPVLAAAHAGPHKSRPALEVIELLQSHGAPDDIFTDAALGRVDAVAARLPSIELDARGPVDSTALFLAAWNGHVDVVRLLLDAGADPGLRCRAGQTAWESALLHAWDGRYREIAHLLLEHGAEGTLHEACELAHLPSVRRLVRERPDAIDAPDARGLRPLEVAVLRGEREVAQVLLDAGAADPRGRARALAGAEPEVGRDHAGAVFRRSSFRTATFNDVDLADATFYNANLSGAQFGYVTLAGARIDSGNIQGLTVYGVEVEPLVLAELERRRRESAG